MQTFAFFFSLLLFVLEVSQVFGFDICAAGEPYSAIQLVNSTGCSGCTDYLLCVGFRNAVTQCNLIDAVDANTTATLISANNDEGDFANYTSVYLNLTYNSAAVSDGLNGANCTTLYGSSSNCTVTLVQARDCREEHHGRGPRHSGREPRGHHRHNGRNQHQSRKCRLPASLL